MYVENLPQKLITHIFKICWHLPAESKHWSTNYDSYRKIINNIEVKINNNIKVKIVTTNIISHLETDVLSTIDKVDRMNNEWDISWKVHYIVVSKNS